MSFENSDIFTDEINTIYYAGSFEAVYYMYADSFEAVNYAGSFEAVYCADF